MKINIVGGSFSDNGGDGIRIRGNADLNISDTEFLRNGGQGINVINPLDLISSLGLPKEVDPKELANLINSIRGTSIEKQKEIIESSSFFKNVSDKIMNSASFISNIVTIANAPTVQAIVSSLTQ